MRNLKKFLALVLAMAMAFSLMLTASAVDYDDYQDKDSITAEFTEAVQVLTGLKVMQGDEKGFRPGDYITRAEAAAVIYRAVTGDVTDRQTDLYKDYATFTDVNSSDWFAGYVGYCQNAGYIKGNSPTTFNPYGKVTGYEVLAMILRAVGYGKNNEFTGSSWQVNVAALSKQLGVTKDVVSAHMDQTLNMAAPREVVADLVFMTMATVPTVTFTPALAYNDKQSVVSNIYNPTLGQLIFGLFHSTSWQTIDDWGRPGYFWYQDGVWPNNTWLTTANTGFGYVIPADHPWYTFPTSWSWDDLQDHIVATIGYAPSYETKEQVLECDVADALDIETQKTFRLFVNGTNGGDTTILTNGNACNIGAIANNYRIVATDTVTKVGGQGRVTEFYNDLTSKWFLDDTGYEDRAVMIDTFLTRIDAKRDAKLDPAGHVITPAQLDVTIYDGLTQGAVNNSSSRVLSKARTDATNWDEYSKGDYILLNAWTNKTGRTSAEQREAAAFQPNKVVTDTNNILYTDGAAQLAWIVDNGNDGKAENFQGKQSTIYFNQGKHEVNGTEYKDQIELFLDLAGRTTGTTYTWFLDQYGNLIGIGDAHSVRFGVITGIYAAFGQGTEVDETTGRVKAVATVKYSDGTTGTEYIDAFRMSYGMMVPNDAVGTVAGTAADAAAGGANRTVANLKIGYRTEPGTMLGNGGGLADGAKPLLNATANLVNTGSAVGEDNKDTIELYPVYDTVQHPALSVGKVETAHSPTGVGNVAQVGWLYLAPSSSTNTNAHFASDNQSTDAFHILYDNLFMFTATDDENVVATEIAGSWGTNNNSAVGAMITNATNTNPLFQGMANGISSTTGATAGKLYKGLSYLTYTPVTLSNPNDAADTAGSAATGTSSDQQLVYVDNETQIMIKMGDNTASRTINCYDGVSALPGDVTIARYAEIDWIDTDGDNRAEFLYISNASIPSTVTYGLFYYNGGTFGNTAQWNGSDGTITGYLNGKLETLTFNRASFNTVNGSESTYLGHLFAVRMENGTVVNVLSKAYQNGGATTYAATPRLLMTGDATTANNLHNATGVGLTAANGGFNGNTTNRVSTDVIGTPTVDSDDKNASHTADRHSAAGGDAAAIVGTIEAGTTTYAYTDDDALKEPFFGLGTGNSYTANTRAVYYRDNFSNMTVTGDVMLDTWLEYVREGGGNRIVAHEVGVGDTHYWLAPNVDIIGDLDWLNTNRCDVTMVYEEGAARSVTQIYISRLQSDITPSEYAAIFGGSVNTPNVPDEILNGSDAIQDAYVKGQDPGAYVFGTDMSSAGDVPNPESTLYFVYRTLGLATNATLEIRNSYNMVVYRDTLTSVVPTATTGHYFYVDFGTTVANNSGTDPSTAWWTGAKMPAGTYTYTITDTTGIVGQNSGTFVVK